MIKGKNVLLVDSLLLPYTFVGMARSIKEKGGKIIGGVSVFATPRYDPEKILSLATIELDTV